MRSMFLMLLLCLAPFVSAAETETEEKALPPLTEEVVLEVTVTWPEPVKPLLDGVTNLPDGTLLNVSATPADAVEATVKDGAFQTALGGEAGLAPGDYTVQVNMLLPMSQPDEVKAVIGENGENLAGEAATQPMKLTVGGQSKEADDKPE